MSKSVEQILVEYQKLCSGVMGCVDKFPEVTDTYADKLRDCVGSTDHTVRAYTIKELLSAPDVLGNQTKLATFLDINRGTLRKYMKDDDKSRHSVLFMGGGYTFMSAAQSPKS